MNRYEKECRQLGVLAEKQLNLPKNAVKPDFEGYTIHYILELLDNEIYELKDELICRYDDKQREKLEYDLILNEIGDTAACLAGLLSKINRMRDEEHDDGA